MTNPPRKQRRDPRHIPGFLLWQASKLWQRHLSNTLKPLQLGSTEFVILGNLVRLAEQETWVSQIMLSDATKVDPMTTSHVIRSLHRKKLVKRVIHPEDRRAYYVVPTERGVALAERARDEIIQLSGHFFASLKQDEAQFLITLQNLIEANNL